ncbi:MAG: hypothetical protein AB7O52_19825 [Planctomycetota bacterium]
MTSDNGPFDRREQWVESLIRALDAESEEHAQSLVTAGLQRLEASTRRVSFAWRSAAVFAATVLAGVLIFFGEETPKSAHAFVRETLQVALQDIGRHYSVQTRVRSERGSFDRELDWYMRGGRRFVARIKAIEGPQELWVGRVEDDVWVVPPFGPVLVGELDELQRFMEKRVEIDGAFIYLKPILEKMRDQCDLEVDRFQTLSTPKGDVECRHIVGTPQTAIPGAPARIELWADRTTGVAVRVHVDWAPKDGVLGKETLTLSLEGDLELTDDFFTPDAHGGEGRSRLPLGSTPLPR